MHVDQVIAALGLPQARTSRHIDTGFDAEVWRVETASEVIAVRVLQLGRRSDDELAGMDVAKARGVPVPHLIASGEVDGRAAIATTWCAGSTIGDQLVRRCGDPRVLGELFGRTHAALHRPDDAGRVQCHLDFQPFNVLTDRGRVTGIIDWTNWRFDDPRIDLATTRVVLALGEVLVPDARDSLPTFVEGWQAGYGAMPNDRELAPFLERAAHQQLLDWEARTGQVPDRLIQQARAIAERRW